MEILISVVAKIAEYLVTPIVHPYTYLCSYKTNGENLKNEISKLKAARDSVQKRVDASKIQGEDIQQNVKGWLMSVEKIIDTVGRAIEEEEKSNHQCFNGLCPNFKNRYQFSKKPVKVVKAMARSELVNQWYESKQNIRTSLVLHEVKSIEFPEVLECLQLKVFSIDSHNSSITIPDEFFMRMKELRVLNLSYVDLLSLPSSFCRLINLQTLLLYDCKLANMAAIGYLKKLEILCLRGSTIKHLPVQVGQLTRLKLLDLRDCYNLEVVPPNLISCLSHLQELYMGRFAEWEVEGLNNERRNASLEELKI